MNKQVLEDKLEQLRGYFNLERDHIACAVIKGQIELLETLIEALP